VTTSGQRPVTATTVVVKDGRHPIAVLTMLAATLSGLAGLLGPPNPSSTIDKLLPEPWRTWYYLLLLISGVVVSVAVWLPDIRDRLIWERIGLLPFTGVLLVYPLALINSELTGLPLGAAIGAMFGIGGCWRIAVITYELRRWKQTIRRLREAEVNP
jgi:hypothetical protein